MDSPAAKRVPEVIGPYAIVDRIGCGGMGDVYRAHHRDTGQRVALKVLSAQLAEDARMRARFLNEARVVAAIHHPNVVALYESGSAGGHVFIAMELLEGETLAARLSRGARLPAAVAIAIGREIAAALGAAHAVHVAHRDLKPQNVMLVGEGNAVKVLDFGIAKILDAALGGTDGLTKTGSIIGTPLYMSPEQCKNAADIDHRSDIYSLGCVLYRMLAGRPPFSSGSAGEVIGMHLYVDPRPIDEIAGDVGPKVAALVMGCLKKDPGQRPQTMAEVIAALDAARPMTEAATEMPASPGTDLQAAPDANLSLSEAEISAQLEEAPTTYDPVAPVDGVTGPSPWPRRVIIAAAILAAGVVAMVAWPGPDDAEPSAPTLGVIPIPAVDAAPAATAAPTTQAVDAAPMATTVQAADAAPIATTAQAADAAPTVDQARGHRRNRRSRHRAPHTGDD
ncbi:MAG TPA: serine/threonine-protein kinase, partial [Kofleriaceae bacterium]|nr:serine/threonine-protein kinase [Kofleriaceae bacterium]